MTEYGKNLVRKQWELVSSDIEAACAEAHAKEVETIKELKLEHIWEPSPFPVEVLIAERTSRTAEPIFSVTPWLDRPSWLVGEAPERLGEMRFAKAAHYRNGRVSLQVPLTSEQAEARHRDLEDYVLAVRLPEGQLLLVSRFGWDRNDPEILNYRPDYRPSPWFSIVFHGSSGVVRVSAWQDKEDPGLIDLWSIDAPEWLYYGILRDGERTIHDSRSGEKIFRRFR